MPIFRVKSVKIYTGQKKSTRIYPWDPWQIWGMCGGWYYVWKRCVNANSIGCEHQNLLEEICTKWSRSCSNQKHQMLLWMPGSRHKCETPFLKSRKSKWRAFELLLSHRTTCGYWSSISPSEPPPHPVFLHPRLLSLENLVESFPFI